MLNTFITFFLLLVNAVHKYLDVDRRLNSGRRICFNVETVILKKLLFYVSQVWPSIVMDGKKTFVALGVIFGFMVSGKHLNKVQTHYFLFLHFWQLVDPLVSFISSLWTGITSHQSRWGAADPAAQLSHQHQLHRRARRDLGWTPARRRHRCSWGPLLHSLNLQHNCGAHSLLRVHLCKPGDWPGRWNAKGCGIYLRLCPR